MNALELVNCKLVDLFQGDSQPVTDDDFLTDKGGHFGDVEAWGQNGFRSAGPREMA